MTSFYDKDEIKKLGLKSFGEEVLISRKASFYGAEDISIGSHVRIDDFCILSGKITLGNYIHIAAFSALYGGTDGVCIDDFANISSRVSIYSRNDDYSGLSMTNPMVPEAYKRVESAFVKIGRHVIIGSNSVVLPGIILKEGGAFGSFSFINQDSKEWSIYAGIPCKKIGERKRELLKFEKELKKFHETNPEK